MRKVATSARLAGLAAAAVVVASAIWFASSWVDDPPDDTCGSVWRPDVWNGKADCEGTMWARSTIAATLVAIGLALTGASLIGARRRTLQVAAGASLLAAMLVVLVNEFVRSGGRWA